MTEWQSVTAIVGVDNQPVEGRYVVQRDELENRLVIECEGLAIPPMSLPAGFDIPETIATLAELTLGIWASVARRSTKPN